MDFDKWYERNKDSPELTRGYEDYKKKCREKEELPLPRKLWALERHNPEKS